MCCTPYVATIVAGVLCIFQSFVNLCWNVPLLIGMSLNNNTEAQNLMLVYNFEIETLLNPFAIYGVTLVLALVNTQLLIFSCLLFKANHDMRTDWICAWCILVLLKSIVNVSLGVYFLYEYGNDHLKRIAFFRLAALFSGIFFFWPIVNIILFVMVFKRYRDIVVSRMTGFRADPSPPQNDTQPPPYSPGSYNHRQHSHPPDPASITGWSHQPLLNFDRDDI